MQRITKFSAIIGFLAVMTFVIGMFMYMPTLTEKGFSFSPESVFALGTGGDGGCCGGGGGDGGGGGRDGGGGGGCTHNCNPQPKHPVCTLNVSPTTIYKGESATLTWTTNNASVASIDQGIGSVSLNGNKSVSPTETTTYTLTASGYGETVTCSKTVTVKIKVYDPVCTLNLNPTSIKKGESATLTWTTSNADSVSINQGIGQVSANGNTSVSPTQNTTYTLTATGNGKTVTCEKYITITEIPGLSCDSFNASPSSFGKGGGTTNLSWNTTGATSVSIDQGIGGVAQDGNMSVGVSNSKTFTLTASNAQNTVTCQTSVSVETDQGCTSNCGGGGGGGSSRPSCKFFKASDKDIEEGDKVTLSWETRRGEEILIKDNHGEELLDSDDDDDVDEGSLVVYPDRDTTYTLRVEGKNNKTDSCTVKVNVDDEVRVTTVRDRQPVTTITFREVPYTGFDAGPMLAGLFYALLAAWALVASYIVVIKKGSVMGFSLATAGIAGATGAKFASAPVIARAAVAAPTNLPVATDEEEEEEEVVEEESTDGEEDSAIQNRAFASGIILSADALVAVKNAGTNAEERLTIIDAVISRAKESFAREDGWIALDRARISTLF